MAITQATPFDNILAQCRDLISERLASALAGMLDKADAALAGRENETRDAEAQALYREVREKALPQRQTIEAQFRARYLREFQQRSSRAKRIGEDFSDADTADVELALVGEADLDETLKFNAMTARLRQYCEEELVALDQRVGVLFGDADLQSDDNPFTPQAISDAYKQTCAQVDADVEVRLVLLTLFDEFVLDEIRGIYRAVNALLVQNSILPKLRGAGVTRKARAKPPAPEAKGPEQDFFALLQNLVAQRPAEIAQSHPAASGAPVPAMPAVSGTPAVTGPSGPMAGAGGAGQIVQGEELLRSLTRVQRGHGAASIGEAGLPEAGVTDPATTNVLRELKATSLGGGMSQMDAMTLDIVALLFDQLFDDPKIPIGVKGLIGRLQIPFLKVAIADKAFFSSKAHPARHMLDTLGEVAARLPPDVNASNPTFVRLDKILQELLEAFEDNIEIFDTVRAELDALVTEEDRRIGEQALADEKQVEQKESLALAKTVAQTEIKMRLRASKPPRPVLEFLLRQWIKVLLLVQVKEGEDSDAWKGALETMDLLIWSVEPKETREQRRELVGKVPGLLKRLADALTSAGIDDTVRTRFIADLRKLHSEIIAGNGAPIAAVPEPPAAALQAPSPGPQQPSIAAEAAVTDAPAPPPETVAIEIVPPAAPKLEEPTPVLEPPAIEAGLSLVDAPGESLPVQETAAIGADTTFVMASEEPAPVFDLPDIQPAPAFAAPAVEPEPESGKLPMIEVAPAIAAAPDESATAPRLPTLDFESATPVSSVEPEPDFKIPSIEVAPAITGVPGDSAPTLRLPTLDFAAVSPVTTVNPKPAFELPAIGKAPTGTAKPRDLALSVDARPTAKQPPPAKIERKPAPVAAGPAESESLDTTAPVTVANPFGEGEIEVNDLDFTVQVPGSTSGNKPASALLANLTLGTWVDIVRKHGKEKQQTAKLTFISPLKTRYLFADRHGKTALECSQAELVRLVQLNEVTVTREPSELPLFDRLAEGLVGKLGQRR